MLTTSLPFDLPYVAAFAAALAFAALCLRTLAATTRRKASANPSGSYSSGQDIIQQGGLAIAFATTAVWIASTSLFDVQEWLNICLETARNLAWLTFMYLLLRPENFARQDIAVRLIYITVAGLNLAVLAVTMLDALDLIAIASAADYATGLLLAEMIIAISALVLVHNIYTMAASDARAALAMPLGSLAAMWMYDLNLYTISYFADAPADQLIALRPAFMLLLAGAFGLALMRGRQMTFRLSRAATFQTLSLAAIGIYLLVMGVVAALVDRAGQNYGQVAQAWFLSIAAVAGIALAVSPKLRGWLRVTISKHLFRLRYDYRIEWARFTDTIGLPGSTEQSFHERVVKAVADITSSPGGLLLTPDESGHLTLQARWHWPLIDVPREAAPLATSLYLEESGRILIFDELRNGAAPHEEIAVCPQWILQDERLWLGVPCVHYGKLAGLILLQRPAYERKPDWEDRDLLHMAGRQIASYLSEAHSQETLSEVRRFDEFNRRFAFIMHDVKNLVSQLSLVSRNAEKHAHNPEFQADMLQTIKHSVNRMNDLLARLSQHNKAKPEDPRPLAVRDAIDAIIGQKRLLHPLMAGQEQGLIAMADPNRLEQVLGHLVQNAIDASPSDEPVHIMARDVGDQIAIDVLDRGCGMSPEFVRTQLFRPFTSTKEGGFGIGSYEARQLTIGMGGRIDVESVEGEGSRFTILLPKPKGTEQPIQSRHRDLDMPHGPFTGKEAA